MREGRRGKGIGDVQALPREPDVGPECEREARELAVSRAGVCRPSQVNTRKRVSVLLVYQRARVDKDVQVHAAWEVLGWRGAAAATTEDEERTTRATSV